MHLSFFQSIHKKHLASYKNLKHPHTKTLICFAGVPGSGKTTIAKQLSKKYDAVRIDVDGLAQIILKKTKHLHGIYAPQERKLLLKMYLLWFFETYTHKNKMIILDCSVDRKYLEVWALAHQLGYPLFVIDIDVSKEQLLRHYWKRNKRAIFRYLSRLPQWRNDHDVFLHRWHPDFVITNDFPLYMKPIYQSIDHFLKEH